MYRFVAIFRSETIYFKEHISPNVRRVFTSNIFKSISSPLMTTFLNAFVFRASGTLAGVAIYNVGLFVCLPIAFYINGLFLRHINIRIMLAWGAILGGGASIAFVLAGPTTMLTTFLYGCAWGLGNGFYWANRNYLEFQETITSMRQYFYGLILSITSIANIAVPFIAGWFIVIGERLNLYSTKHAYWIIFGFSFILLLICGAIIRRGQFDSPAPPAISRLRIRPFLNTRRLLSIASGFTDGTISLTVVLLVLLLVGNEGILGSLTGLVSFATAVAMYLYGRYVNIKYELRTMLVSSIVFFLAAICLIVLPGIIGIMLYILLVGISTNFFAMSSSPLLFSLAETEMGQDSTMRYSFIFDNELFLNIGRLIAIGILFLFSYFQTETSTLIFGSVAIAGLHLFIMAAFFARNQYSLK